MALVSAVRGDVLASVLGAEAERGFGWPDGCPYGVVATRWTPGRRGPAPSRLLST